MTNGAGLCYLLRCVGTHQVPLDRITYLEPTFQHPVINATATQTDSPDSSLWMTCSPVLKHRQNTRCQGMSRSCTGQLVWGMGGTRTNTPWGSYQGAVDTHCLPLPVTPALPLAILSSPPPRKPPRPQRLSKQEFGSAAIHCLPWATVSEQGKGHYCRQLFANHLQDSVPLSTHTTANSPAHCLCCCVAPLVPSSRQSLAASGLNSENAAQFQAGWHEEWQCLTAQGPHGFSNSF